MQFGMILKNAKARMMQVGSIAHNGSGVCLGYFTD